jgi:hypothetical protein
LRVQRERGVTTGEHQAKTIVLHAELLSFVAEALLDGGFERERLQPALLHRSMAHVVDRLVARRRDEPARRVLRRTVCAPLLEGGDERLVCDLFSQGEITQHADQRRDDAAELLPIHASELGLRRHAGHSTGG